ncbi:uncharacterized protein A4U43_C04F4440 [Asparagus officinalis]|uniref:DNA2/NAM7 helicase-like C-terminal domain-containing protein n=1 Tax=Asparagus officinalis TaxID=4686 RepID=A0A5P1F013_ASPOF|nr:uncharacterized protein A4U43_C04F4440 [Asparagus officinalis]
MTSFKRKKEELLDVIRMWSLDDILNENLFKDQIREIPRTFVSVTHYFECFRYPFLEEIRAQLESCLNRIASAPRFNASIEEDEKDFAELKNAGAFSCLAFVTGADEFDKRWFRVQSACSCCVQSECRQNEVLLQNLEVKQLNEAQIAAVCQVLSCMRCSHAFSVGRISGFPGTGKTEIIATACSIALLRQCKVAVCAPNPYSVLEIVSRVLKIVGHSCNTFDDGITGLTRSDIVLLGEYNSMHQNIFSGLSVVPLDELTKLLKPCFSSYHGWKECLTELVSILEREHGTFSECEKNVYQPENLEVLKEEISSTALTLKNHIQLLLKYIPCSLLSDCGMQNLTSLLSIVDSMLKFLSGDGANLKWKEFCTLRNSCLGAIHSVINTVGIPVTADKKSIEHLYLEHARLLFCPISDLAELKRTCGSCGLDLLIVDRACEIMECESLPLLQLDGLHHAILFGGNGYKPASIISKNLLQIGYGRSLFKRLNLLYPEERNLVLQYRMHPFISCFPNKKFFKQKLLDSQTTVAREKEIPLLPECISGAYRFLDVSDGRETIEEQSECPRNLLEAAIICKIILKLIRASSWKGLSIGVISPSSAQVQTIQSMLQDKFELASGFRIWIKTVSEIESSEEEVIIISTVCCNDRSGLRSLLGNQVTNFCLTRARKFLWIVGNREMLKKSSSIWKEVVLDAEERGCLYVASQVKFLAETIFTVKNEIKELDELLNQGGVHFNGTKWKVLVSNDFKKSFVGIQSALTQQIIIAFLWRLACGWRPKRKRLYFSKYIKQFRVHGLTIVCTVDIIREIQFIQVIKIWDVLTLAEIPKLIRGLDDMASSFGDKYVKYCSIEKVEGDLVVPMSWEVSHELSLNELHLIHGFQTESRVVSLLDGASSVKHKDGLMLMKFYSLSSRNVKHLLNASDGQEIELPFEVSDVESEIISFPDSVFILGRSGTGKTLVLMTKLIQREQLYFLALQGPSMEKLHAHVGPDCTGEYDDLASPTENALSQIFLTVNPILCSSVKDYITRLRRYTLGEERPEGFTVNEAYSGSENLTRFSEIPDSMIEISQCHFPLVISLQKFLIMLDGTVKNTFFGSFSDIKVISSGKRRARETSVLQQLITDKEVTYDLFLSSYWPRFDVNLTRKLDPSFVFAHIIYCIKGEIGSSEASIYKNMKKEEYLNLSNKRCSLVGKEKREMVYQIYICYEKLKKTNEEYDVSDLVNDLHYRLSVYGYDGRKMDFMYIDEVQDFTMKQICLFKYTCINFQSGFQFAGDSAQALVNDFRFQDIKCLFYKKILARSGLVPNFFQLTTNFRTHSGILGLADSVLDLLYHFFPDSVDRLASEKSKAHGEFPVVLESGSDTEVLQTIFGTDTSDNSSLKFGSEQVILVRHNRDKEKVINQIGNNAMVLTIKESKGLEFQDVLLHNFFCESPLKNRWRIVYEFMDDKKIVNPWSSMTFPQFDCDKHHLLCSELKQLYVAVTRTRNRLWIAETNNVFAKPVFEYWKAAGVIQVQRLDFTFIKKMQVTCTKEEWNARGTKFLNEGNYEMSILCFKRSGNVYMENWAKAAGLQSEGSLMLRTNFNVAKNWLLNAADLYMIIGRAELAAVCLVKAKKYRKAGMLYLDKFHEPRFEDAGDCFALASCWSEAAKAYAQGRCLSKCLSACHEGLHFDLGFHFLKEWPIHVSTSDWIDYANSTLRSYYKLKNLDSLSKFVRAFPNDLINLLLESENFEEAAAIARLRGDILFEAEIMQKAKEYVCSSSLMLSDVVGKMLWLDKNKCFPLKQFHQLDNILAKAKDVAMLACKDVEISVSAEANFLADHCADISALAIHIDNAKRSQNICLEILASRCMLEICLHANVCKFYHELDFSRVQYRGGTVHDMLSQGYLSVQVLMFAWNLWKKNIKDMLFYVQSYGTPVVSKYAKHEKFCMKYFGVYKLHVKGVYISPNHRASWMNYEGRRNVHMVDNITYISDSEFNSLAADHFLSEIISIGNLLLQKLKDLHKFLLSKEFFVIQRGVIAHHFYRALGFLKEYGISVPRSQLDGLDESLNQFRPLLFQTFFPLDCDIPITLDLLDSCTQSATIALVTVIFDKNLEPVCHHFESMKIARALVFLLARELGDELFWRASQILSANRSWRRLLQQQTKFRSNGCWRTTPLVERFLALSNLDLQNQLLLLEDVLFCALLCEIGRGWIITSTSALLKFSRMYGPYSRLFAAMDIISLRHVYESSCSIYDFILDTARELLFVSHLRRATVGRVKVLEFFRSLVLRTVVLISIVCLNSPKHFLKVKEILREADGILLGLPYKFLVNFWNARKCQLWSIKCFGAAFSKSMKSVHDQLVVVRLDDCTMSFEHLTPFYVKHSSFHVDIEQDLAVLLGKTHV